MFLLDPLQKVLLLLFLTTAMLSLGLQVTVADVRQQVLGKGLLLRTLLANFVVVPGLGILVARWLAVEPGVAAAFILLACTPGGISALQFTTKAKGGAAYAGVATVLLSVLAVVLSPLLLALALPQGAKVLVPYAGACSFVLFFLLLPLACGMLLRAKAERAAGILAKVLGLVSAIAFVTMMVLLLAPRKEAMQQIGGPTVGFLLLFVALSMLAGWLLGGPETVNRQVLASATSMRNVPLALAIAVTFPDADKVLPALVAFSALMVPPNLLLTIGCLVANKRRARQAEGTPVP